MNTDSTIYSEPGEGAAVADAEEVPVLQVRDGAFDGGAVGVDRPVGLVASRGLVPARRVASASADRGPDVAEVTEFVPLGKCLGEVGLAPGENVVPTAGHGVGDREEAPGERRGDLEGSSVVQRRETVTWSQAVGRRRASESTAVFGG